MRKRDITRISGKITSWNAGKGFGFVTPNNAHGKTASHGKGASRIFVHISDFASRRPEPAVGQIVSYTIGQDEEGRRCCKSVTRATDKPRPRAHRVNATAAAFAIVFAIALLIARSLGRTPLVVVVIYGTLSMITFLAYAIDKSAAKNDRWRTKESTLHLLALVGGWPGAVAAQNLLRHKSKKVAFRDAFWMTVFLNLAALVWLHSEYGSEYLQVLVEGFKELVATFT